MACLANNPRVTRQVDAWKYQAIAALPASSFGAKRSKADMLRWAKVMQSPDLLHGSRESKLDVLNKFDRHVSLPISVYRLGDLEELGVKATPLYEVTRADKDWWDKKFDEDDRKENPIFLPKSLFDSYVVKSDGGEVTADRIQTLKGAEKKVAELARKYPCVGFSITSAKHGGVIKHYAASVGRGGPRVDKDNSREYKREATQAAKDSVRFRLFVNGSEYADYETKGEAEKVGKKEAGSGGKWRVKQVAANPSGMYQGPAHSNVERLRRQLHGVVQSLSELIHATDREDIRAMRKGLEKRRDELEREIERHHNPMTGVPSHDIPLELRHGRSQREAVAMALSEQGRVAENPVEVFMSERDARRFAASTLGASVIPGQSGGWVVVYPVGGRMRNPNTTGTVWVLDRELPLARKIAAEYGGKEGKSEWYSNMNQTPFKFRSSVKARSFERTIADTMHYRAIQEIHGRSNPTAGNIEPGTLPKVHYSMGQSNAALNRSLAMKAMKAGMTPEEIHHEWSRIWSLSDGKLAQIYDSEFASHPGVYETKYTMLNVPEVIARYKKGSKAKRNPSDEDAAAMYETFHGEPSEEVLEYHVEEFERVDWATLGDLIQLKVETSTGKLVELNAPDPERSTIEDVIKLVSSPDGKQMAFVGGDQCLDEATLTRLGFTEADIRDNMVIGLVREFTYRTQKAFDKFKTIDYYHEAGEEHPVRKVFDDFRRKPTLLYCPHDGLMKLAGGLYQVKDVGVVN